MTPFDKPFTIPEGVDAVAHISGAKPKPSDPGEPVQAPNDPGDELKPLTPGLPDEQLPLSLRYRDQTIERQQNLIRELEDELRRYEEREREIIALVARHQREEAYRHLHENRMHRTPDVIAPYPQGLGGTGQCDCTMGRAALIQPTASLRARIERAILSMAKG